MMVQLRAVQLCVVRPGHPILHFYYCMTPSPPLPGALHNSGVRGWPCENTNCTVCVVYVSNPVQLSCMCVPSGLKMALCYGDM